MTLLNQTHPDTDVSKIDGAATSGLTGVADSLAYRVHEIERHLHNYERALELAAVPNGEAHVADRAGTGGGPFVIDAGDDTWGAWVQILGSADTPTIPGKVRFDPQRIQISGAERNATYIIQIGAGASAAAALTAGTFTEFVYTPEAVQTKPDWLNIGFRAQAAGTKLWARCICPGQNTAYLNFYLGLHEYEG